MTFEATKSHYRSSSFWPVLALVQISRRAYSANVIKDVLFVYFGICIVSVCSNTVRSLFPHVPCIDCIRLLNPLQNYHLGASLHTVECLLINYNYANRYHLSVAQLVCLAEKSTAIKDINNHNAWVVDCIIQRLQSRLIL